jgi:hypothetical protein
MKQKILIFLLAVSISSSICVHAQIDSVIVEKYYISDSKDETNKTGSILMSGSVTYRLYIDLSEGSRLLRIYGNENHALKFSSTEYFFNNTDRGMSTGREVRASRLNQNTLALDTWITLGLASDTHSGIPKQEDKNGSVVGGTNNDGGSAGIPGGLLVNADPSAGIPLTSADGIVPAAILPTNWNAQLNGVPFSSSSDTSIFGNIKQGKRFVSNQFNLSNSGTTGSTEKNRILVAQLTTKGELTFSLNVEIEEKNGTGTKIVKYVAENPTGEEKTNRFLSYPFAPPPQPKCGCKDPDYMEYNNKLDCSAQDSCKTKIYFGCTDPNACNYDPKANFNVPGICCYPGRCNNRDINIICPELQKTSIGFSLYPNPAQDNLNLEISNAGNTEIICSVFDSNGSVLVTENLGLIHDTYLYRMNVECLPKGFYVFSLRNKDTVLTRTFIKK